jgi:Tol biopolymer transport system component
MGLVTGSRLGAYEILSSLGAGGMGEVYRARDTKLGREVAIKVVQGAFAADPDRISRLQREAKVLASVTHHHIAALYGADEAGGQHFLVMELVEGETLADRLSRGPLPVEDALRIAMQIAEALEAAHEKGIVHRDLKPANVKITPDERVKVLDFGLAKASETEPASGASLANSPTLSMMATSAGLILGTAAYMSPEQAKGLPADHRSDIFSFGIVLFEMLTGRQPFQGETAPDVLASVLVREPELGRLASDLNPRLGDLLRRCLEKNPKRRWQAIGDVRSELESIAAAPRATAAAPHGGPPRPLWRRAVPVVLAALIAGAGGALVAWRVTRPGSQAVTRFSILLESGQTFGGSGRHILAISPDGTQIAYNASPGRLMLRRLDTLEAKPVAGSEIYPILTEPVFSPDGLSIAYYVAADQTLKRIPTVGGAPSTIGPARNPLGMTWQGDWILFGHDQGISRVAAKGGTPETLVPAKLNEAVHGPQLLPDGEHLLYTLAVGTSSDRWDKARIVVRSLKTGDVKTVLENGTDARWIPTGHLVYAFGGTLFAIGFDPGKLEVTGSPVPVVEGVRRSNGNATGAANYSFSQTGSLVYISGPASTASSHVSLAITDAKGGVEPLPLPAAAFQSPRVSPDGLSIAYSVDEGKDTDIWVYQLAGTTAPRRLTFGADNRAPVWSPDGRRIVFQSSREGDASLFVQGADGTDAARRLTRAEPGTLHTPESWSPDAGTILFSIDRSSNSRDLAALSVRDGTVTPWGNVHSLVPIDATFSPDGRWVAYTKHDATTTSVFVQPFPATGSTYQLPAAVGQLPHHPVWSPDGKSLFYNPAPTTFETVNVTTHPTFAFGNPAQVRKVFTMGPPAVRRAYDITPGGRLVGVVAPGQTAGPSSAPPIHVVLNWFDDLRARVPVR